MAARNPHAQQRDLVKVEEFAPECIVKFLTEMAEAGKKVEAPCKEDLHTVAVFADICRFTALSEWFARQGGLGSEELGFFLNRYFELLVKTVSKHGGDVVKFAGDAVLIIWPEERSAGKVDLRTMCMRAVMCCTAIQTELGRAQLTANVEFNIKLGIGVGHVNLLHIGGVFGRMEYLCTGAALNQAFACEHDCKPGGVVVSGQVWDMVGAGLDGSPLPSGNVVVRDVVSKIRTKRLQRTEPSPYLSDVPRLLRSYVPAAILPHLQYSSRKWASELRTLTVLFVNLGFMPKDLAVIDTKQLNKLNQVLKAVQRAIYKFEGSLNKFLIDDKGSTLLAVLGLPPLAHADDPERGVLAAVGVAEDLRKLGMEPYIGVTSGIALCGPTGSGSRREYSVLGDVVNTSARLMQMAKYLELTRTDDFMGCILCDEATRSSAESNSSLVFEDLPPIKLKGKEVAVKVSQPAVLRRPFGHVPVLWDNKTPPVVSGFHGLDVDLVEKVQGMIFTRDAPNPVLLGGENGCGKTTLVKHFVRQTATLFGAVLAVPMPSYDTDEAQVRMMMGNVSSVFGSEAWFTNVSGLVAAVGSPNLGLTVGASGTNSALPSPAPRTMGHFHFQTEGPGSPTRMGSSAAGAEGVGSGAGTGAGTGAGAGAGSGAPPVAPTPTSATGGTGETASHPRRLTHDSVTEDGRRSSGGGSGGSSNSLLAAARRTGSERLMIGASAVAASGAGAAGGRATPSPKARVHRADSRASLQSTWTLSDRRGSYRRDGERRGSGLRNELPLLAGRRASVDSTFISAVNSSPGVRRFSGVSRMSGSSFRGRSFLSRAEVMFGPRETDYTMIKARPRKRRSFVRRRFGSATNSAAASVEGDGGDESKHMPPTYTDAVMGGTLWGRRQASTRSIRSLMSGDRPLYPCRIVYAIAQTFRESVRCFVWRQVVHQLTVDAEHCFSETDREELYNLGCAIRDKRLFEGDTPNDQREREEKTLLRLVQLHAQHVPLVIVMDEMQWASDREWELIEALAAMLDRHPGVAAFLLVVTQPLHKIKYQPNFRPVAKAYFRFLGMLSTEFWEMEPMLRTDLDLLIKEQLHLEAVPSRLSSMVATMSGGYPRFARNFLSALLKVRIVSLTPSAKGGVSLDGQPRMVASMNTSRLDVLPLPYKVQRIIATFIDRLTDRQNFILKMACVLCLGGGITHMVFDMHLLYGSFPTSRNRRISSDEDDGAEKFRAMLHDIYEMVQFGLLAPRPYSCEPGGLEHTAAEDHPRRFAFTSGVIRDVVYHRMLHSQRKRQHKQAADYLRREVDSNPKLKGRLPLRELNKHVYRHLKLAEEREQAETHYRQHLSGAAAKRMGLQLTGSNGSASSGEGGWRRRHTIMQFQQRPTAVMALAQAETPDTRKRGSLFVNMFKSAMRRGSRASPRPTLPAAAPPRHGHRDSLSSQRVESMRLTSEPSRAGMTRGGERRIVPKVARLSPRSTTPGGPRPVISTPAGMGGAKPVISTPTSAGGASGAGGLIVPGDSVRSGLAHSDSGDSHDIHSDHEAELEHKAATATPKARGFIARIVGAMSCKSNTATEEAVKVERTKRERRRRLSQVPVIHVGDASHRFGQQRKPKPAGEQFNTVGGGFGLPTSPEGAARRASLASVGSRARRRSSTCSAASRGSHTSQHSASPARSRRGSVAGRTRRRSSLPGLRTPSPSVQGQASEMLPPGVVATGAVTGGEAKGTDGEGGADGEGAGAAAAAAGAGAGAGAGSTATPAKKHRKVLPPLSAVGAHMRFAAAECITPGRRGLRVNTPDVAAKAKMSEAGKQFVRHGTWRVLPAGGGSGGNAAAARSPAIRGGSSAAAATPQFSLSNTGVSGSALLAGRAVLGSSAASPKTRMAHVHAHGSSGSLMSIGDGKQVDDDDEDDDEEDEEEGEESGRAEARSGDTATPLASFHMRRASRGDVALAGRIVLPAKRRRFSDTAVLRGGVVLGSAVHRRRASFYGLADDAEDQQRIGRIMQELDNWTFNVMALDHVSDGTPLLHVATEVFERRRLLATLGIPKEVLQNFVTEVENGYLDHPFHNSIHAADVLQTTHVLLRSYEQYHPVTPARTLALFVAAMIHDYKHPGVTNYYVVRSHHPIHEVYKGPTALEQFHVDEGLAVMQRIGCDLFGYLTDADRRQCTELVRSLVLATSLDSHFDFCQTVDGLLKVEDLDYSDPRMEEIFLKLLIKTADVSYAGKPFHIHKLWVDRFSSEGFAQGDKEREAGLGISTYHDRFTSTAAQCQLALGTFIALPLFNKFGRVAPMARDLFQGNAASNARFWQQEDRCHGGTGAAVVDEAEEEEEDKAHSVPLLAPLWRSGAAATPTARFTMHAATDLAIQQPSVRVFVPPGVKGEKKDKVDLEPEEVMTPADEEATSEPPTPTAAATKSSLEEKPAPHRARRLSRAKLMAGIKKTRAAVRTTLMMRSDMAQKVRFSLAHSFL